MNPADLCQAWRDLLRNQNPGQIYDLFKKEQPCLVSHLLSCIDCALRVRSIFPISIMTNDHLKSVNKPDFAELIRKVRKTYRTKWP